MGKLRDFRLSVGACGSCGKRPLETKTLCASCAQLGRNRINDYLARPGQKEKYAWGARWRKYVMYDKSHGYGEPVSFQEFKKIVQGVPCVYCAFPAIGLDRIDNSKGHTADNVSPCCKECNFARRDIFTPEEMRLYIGPAIAKAKSGRAAQLTV